MLVVVVCWLPCLPCRPRFSKSALSAGARVGVESCGMAMDKSVVCVWCEFLSDLLGRWGLYGCPSPGKLKLAPSPTPDGRVTHIQDPNQARPIYSSKSSWTRTCWSWDWHCWMSKGRPRRSWWLGQHRFHRLRPACLRAWMSSVDCSLEDPNHQNALACYLYREHSPC